MNIDTGLASVKQIGTVATSSIGTVKRLVNDLALLRGAPATPAVGKIQNYVGGPAWFQGRQPAMFRGVKFAVLTSEALFGRRNAIHEYPFRETLWVEDLGRSARRITITGFLLEGDVLLGGQSLDYQIKSLINACETKGEGSLFHPTLGTLKVGLLAPVAIRETWDKGRMAVLTFSFIENGTQAFPARITETPQNTQDKVIDTSRKVIDLFGQQAAPSLLEGAAQAVQGIVNTTNSWADKAQKLANDATNIFGMASTASAVLTDKSRAATRREVLRQAAKNMADAAARISAANAATDYPNAVQAFTTAVHNTGETVQDDLRMLTVLATTDPAPAASGAGLSRSVTAAVTYSNNLLRRMAVIAAAQATSLYDFTSYDEAIAVLAQVTSLLDQEILYAGDAGDDAAFVALRSLRAAVTTDVTTRGASLAPLKLFSIPSPTPAPVVALRIYADATRADDLIARVKPVHPAFMPTSFMALAR